MKPLVEAELHRVTTVFTDVDGTLTSGGRLASATLRAVEWLVSHRVEVVLVSGRPSGWGECWARELPVAGAIVENGGLYYAKDQGGGLKKVFAQPLPERRKARAKLQTVVDAALAAVRGARLSSDSHSREVDLAIDYAEDAALGPRGADRLEAFMHAHQVRAVRSSVHVNCWVGGFDKRSMVRHFLRRERGTVLAPDDRRFVYVGDSFNDAPLFDAFPLSVGVANVREVLDTLEHRPKFVTRGREGKGFNEVADAVVRARRRRR